MLKLGVKKYSESTQLIDPSKVHGTVKQVIADFIKELGIKDAELRPKLDSNVKRTGALMMFIIREVDKSKDPKDLLCSDDIMLSKKMSDAIRTGELHFSALNEFVVVQHTNWDQGENAGAEYPLLVRPTDVADDSALDKFAVKSGQVITKKYERSTEDIDSIMDNLML